jgi:hypothetical protein
MHLEAGPTPPASSSQLHSLVDFRDFADIRTKSAKAYADKYSETPSDATPKASEFAWNYNPHSEYGLHTPNQGLGAADSPTSPDNQIHGPPGSSQPELRALNIQGLATSPHTKARPVREPLQRTMSRPISTPQNSTPGTTNLTTPDSKRVSVARDEKDLKERWNLMKELIDTEHSFFHDMTIAVDIFMATCSSVTALTIEDRKVIFGNVESIRDFVAKFLDALKKSVVTVYQIPSENRFHFKRTSAETSKAESNSNGMVLGVMPEKEFHPDLDRQTTVGAAFCQYTQEMDILYREWMIHQEASNKRIQQVQPNPQVKMWLDECYANARDITNAWNLDSLLVKPTQRYMKYPLLLRGLLKCTPPDHPDYEMLTKALAAIEDSANDINEEKKRREVATQVLRKQSRDGKNPPSSRLNLKNLMGRNKKKRSPSQHQALGLEDDDYEALRQKFGGHFFQLQIVMRDFEKYMEDSRIFMHRMARYVELLAQNYNFDGSTRYPEEESRVLQFVEVVNSINKHALTDHVFSIQRFVIDPVRKLWHLHENPQLLMGKHRKLKPLYLKYLGMKQRKDRINEKLQMEVDQYIAINDTLKKELPLLYGYTKDIVHSCLRNFLDIQVRWTSMWMQKLKPLLFDFNPDKFFEGDMSEFFQQIRDEFYQGFDQWDEEREAQTINTGKYLMDDEYNFLSKMPEPDQVYDSSQPGSSRPSTSSRRLPVSHSARGSVEHAARSTPNLALGGPPPLASNHPHRLSYNNSLSPPVPGGFYSGAESFYTQNSGANSGGPTTPLQPPSGQQTPSAFPGSGTAGQRQWFQSDWASHAVAQTEPGEVLSEGERLRLERGYDALSAHQAAHQYHMEREFRGEAAPLQAHSQSYSQSSNHLAPPNDNRYSDIFRSALPSDVAEDEEALMLNGPAPVTLETDEPRVLFVVASLFEFHIDSNRREAGFPYLKYVAGEVFDILAQRGELWLARNQDDPEGRLGWIWEKHFALLPTEET